MNPDSSQLQPLTAAVDQAVPYTLSTGGADDFASTAAAALSDANLSHAQLAQYGTPTTRPTRKRKPAAPGSRGVSTLTPEQLTKKRANDREAQRAIRERTKNTIDELRLRIQELESQQPYQALQRALEERDKALAECVELRQRLAAVAGIVGDNAINQTGLNELAALTVQQTPMRGPEGNEGRYDLTQGERDMEMTVPDSVPISDQPETVEQQNLHPDLRTSTSQDRDEGAAG